MTIKHVRQFGGQYKVIISIILGAALWTLAEYILHRFLGHELRGFLAMYFAYELTHRRLHTREPSHAYAKFMRAHHFHHHHVQPSANHGFTIAIWDRVFGTFVKANLDDVYSLEKSGEAYEDSIMECKRNQGLC